MSEPILALEDLACERDERLLFLGIRYACDAGSVLQITGSNGAGKTTLLRTLCGLMPPSKGRIVWRGQDIQRTRADFHRELLFIGHQSPVKGLLTPLENIHWLSQLRTLAPDAEARAALTEVGLAGYEDIPCNQLSAGQRRRVLLAQLYLSGAALWVLDEPFTAIDAAGVAGLEACIERHRARGGIAVITSHQSIAIADTQILDLQVWQPSGREAYLDE